MNRFSHKSLIRSSLLLAGLLLASVAPLHAQQPLPAPAGAAAYVISPADGAKLSNPVVVRFGLKGMGIAPAGTQMENTGHHHLFIDTDLPANLTQPIPAVEGKILHFGKGQTETTLTLSPGTHTLQLMLGDHLHIPNNPAVSSTKITITVAP